MFTSSEFLHELAAEYHPKAQPKLVPKPEGIRLGRLLVENGYKMVGSYVVDKSSGMNIAAMLRDLDKTSRNDPASSMMADGEAFVGPFYQNVNSEDYCPIGIAIWKLDAEVATPPTNLV